MWNRWFLSIFAILTGGFLLRAWGIEFGLPHEYCRPDETTLIYRALSIGAGDLNPHFFNYPSLHFYLVTGVFGLTYLTGLCLGYFKDLTDFQRLLFADPTVFYLVGRAMTVVFGTSTIALVYDVGSRLESRRAGVVGAAFFAVAFLHVRDSHFLTVDVPATFWILAAYSFACRHIEKESVATGALAGACIGLAASTKYNAALFLPSIVLALSVTQFSAPVGGSRIELIAAALKAKWKHLVVMGTAAAASFVIGSPYALLTPAEFIRDLSFERTMFAAGRGLDLGPGWIYHFQISLWNGLGWPLLLAGLAGCVVLALRHRPLDLVFISGIITYYGVAGSGKSVFVRYMIPLVPFLCMAAAVALVRVTNGFRGRLWLPVATCFIAGPSLSSSVQFDRILSRRDTRLMAANWIEENLPSGTRIALAGSEYGYPRIRRTPAWKQARLADLQKAGEQGRRLATELRIIADRKPDPAYDTVELRERNPQGLRSVWTDFSAQVLQDSGVTWVVTQDHPLPFSSLPSRFRDDPGGLGSPLQTFDPFVHGEPVPGFDPIDAFYVPLSGFSAVERPGPLIHIFRLAPALQPPGQDR